MSNARRFGLVVGAVMGLVIVGSALGQPETTTTVVPMTTVSGPHVDFCINSGFENTNVVAGLPGDYGENTAHPWSYWGDTVGVGTNGAVANPFVDASNLSSRVWANFGNPTYVNVAAQNASSLQPASGFWLVPGATYHFTAQYYVPSTVLNNGVPESNVASNVTPRAGFVLRLSPSDPPGQAWGVSPLDARYYTDPVVEPPVGAITNYPVSPDIALDQWVTFNVSWTFNEALVQHVSYPSFRLYGGDGRYIGSGVGTSPNPGGYFDNCQITSYDYRDDLHGVVKDDGGNPIEGATVTLVCPFDTNRLDVVTTLADGTYTLPTWAPFGYTFSVDASFGTYTSDGPKTLEVSSSAALFPQITLTAPVVTTMARPFITDIQMTGGTSFGFGWASASGVTYRVWWNDDLLSPWDSNQTETVTGGEWADTNSILPAARFYRLSIEANQP